MERLEGDVGSSLSVQQGGDNRHCRGAANWKLPHSIFAVGEVMECFLEEADHFL